MTASYPHSTEISDQIVARSVVFDPDFPPTIPPEMTIADYRRARTPRQAGWRRMRSVHDRETVR